MLLAVQGLVVTVLADHHLHHKAGFRYTFWDELCRHLAAEHLFTAGVSILRTNELIDHKACRDVLLFFAGLVSDKAERHTTVGTSI